MIEGCIFDMDGVIVDTAEAHYQSWLYLTNSWNFQFSRAFNEALKGVSRMKSLEIILQLAGMEKSTEEKEALCAIKNQRYLVSIQGMTSTDILPGILDMLDDLKRSHVKIALGSSSRNAKSILTSLQIDHYFDAMVDGNDLTHGKPNPQVFLLAADKMRLNPDTCLVFEDAAKGVQAAHAAGMKAVGIGNIDTLGQADLVLSSLAGIGWQQVLHQIR